REARPNRLSADIGAAPRSVLDDEWLAEALRQPLSHQACDGVGPAGRGERHDEANRPRWIALRASETGDGRQCGGPRGQMQKISARKFHFKPPSRFTSLDHLVGAGRDAFRRGRTSLPPRSRTSITPANQTAAITSS